MSINIKHSQNRQTDDRIIILNVKTTKHKERKKHSLHLTEKKVSLIGINLYSQFIHFLLFLLNMPVVPENKTHFICILCVFLFLFFYNKYKIMTTIFIFAQFGLNIHHIFYICYLERLCLYNRNISLPALLRQNSQTNMTMNRDKIVKS